MYLTENERQALVEEYEFLKSEIRSLDRSEAVAKETFKSDFFRANAVLAELGDRRQICVERKLEIETMFGPKKSVQPEAVPLDGTDLCDVTTGARWDGTASLRALAG